MSCYIERKIVKISFFFDLQLPPLCFSSFSGRSKSKENEWTRTFEVSRVRPLDPNFKRKVVKDKKTRGKEPVRKDAKEENRKRTDGRNRRHDFSELKFV